MERLGIPKTEWNNLSEQAQKTEINIHQGIKNVAFLGTPVPIYKGTFLSDNLIEQLNLLEIYPSTKNYKDGLISIKTQTNRLDINEFNSYLTNRLEELPHNELASDWLKDLIVSQQLVQLLLHEHLHLPNQNINIEILIKEQDKIYTQIACMFLPVLFLQEINNPINFIERIAPELGRYILLKYKERHND